VFANPDGTFTIEIASGPVRVPDPSAPSGWTPIDTTLQVTAEGIVPEATVADVTFSEGGSEPMADLDTGSRSLTIDWPGQLPESQIEGDAATYPGVLPGADLVLEARPAGFSHSLVLKGPPSEPLVVRFPLELEGLTASISEDGSLSLESSSGKEIVQADPARMWDSSVDPVSSEPVHEALVDTRIVATGDGYALEIAPDPGFFTQELTYPVTVDPSPDLSVNKDAFVYSAFPDTSYNSDPKLKTGYSGTGTARALVKFNTQPISGTHVLSATLSLHETYSASCDPSRANVVRLNSAFQTPTWNDQPSYGGVYASASFANGFDSSCPNAWVALSGGGDDGKTLIDLVDGWASGGIANYGLAIRAENEGATNSWKIFNSSDSANNAPYLSVTYNSYPDVPTGLSATGTTTPHPTLSATFLDPDGGSGQAQFKVRTLQGVIVAEGSGTQANVGYPSTWTIPLGLLTDGESYEYRTRNSDGTDASSYTSWGSFYLDYDPVPPLYPGPIEGYFGTQADNMPVALYDDQNLGQGRVEYHIMDAGCTSDLLVGVGTPTSGGMLSPWTPSTALELGATYGLKARTIDPSGDLSPFTACVTFETLRKLEIGASTPVATSSTTPTLSVLVEEGGTGTVTPTFEVRAVPEGTVVATGSGSTVAPGGVSTWSVPSNILQVGERYTWSAAADLALPTSIEDLMVVPPGPQVALVDPVDGSRVGQDLWMEAIPLGFDAVSSVEFQIDGVTVATAQSSPWYSTVFVPVDDASHDVVAVVHGTANGSALSVSSPEAEVVYAGDFEAHDARFPVEEEPDPPDVIPEIQEVTDFSPPDPDEPMPRVSVSRSRIVEYARRWTSESDPDLHNSYYAFIDGGGRDCTNFVSQALKYGGWPYLGTVGESKNSLYQWWYDHNSFWWDDWTLTWGVSEWLFTAMGPYYGLDYRVDVKWRLRDAEPGDILFVDWSQSPDDPSVDHVMVVTGVRRTAPWNIFLTYHSPSREDRPWRPTTLTDPGESVKERAEAQGYDIQDWFLIHPKSYFPG
jgi:hypothetical protein